MNKLIVDRCDIDNGDVEIHLEFKDRITIVGGDSATGKTYTFNALKDMSSISDVPYIFIDYSSRNMFRAGIKDVKGCMIVIDNADILLTREDKENIINDTNNQYLIFSRSCVGYRLPIERMAEFKMDREACKITMAYPYQHKNEIAFMKRSNNEFSLEYPLLD